MCNELAITRHDIEAWTKEAVAAEVHKLVSGANMKKLAEDAVRASVRQVVVGSTYSGPTAEIKKVIEKAMYEQIAGRVIITVAEKP
jgi:UDP:flavonoid glycosyltransferase YjiC (YdhE family)